ncbi:conserved Plasmodium membrane protein, unknown function [Plasmodium sp. gorilla clade G1]|uniref:YrhK domain-containing protein n=1 Tax=Plasmodium falciparum Vietnam Oak-Knoll (FVO) TaxID=1036723 RepID=A0A024V0W5_PLAFA|nr:hypothetical protein PFFVO_04998 [Plasmodium falciparum Vietnam Oak-Knoll (FVO)]SOS81202.1 conserved Plasmodium membrane protein, unknown function [Plasmodium sp. gorilla clade G1]
MPKVNTVKIDNGESDEYNSTNQSPRKLNDSSGLSKKKSGNISRKASSFIYKISKNDKKGVSFVNKKGEYIIGDEDASKITFRDFLNCPLEYHTNVMGTVLFILGSAFFLYPPLYISGCVTFAIACALCLYSNFIGAINKEQRKKNEYYGFILYIIGCAIFILGSIYSCFENDIYSIITFIIGSLFFLWGSIMFLFSIKFTQIKNVDINILVVFFSNFIGGILFTVGSVFFFYPQLYDAACYLFIIGSIIFTLAVYFDYIIYINNNFTLDIV